MNYFIRGRVVSGKESSCFLNVVYVTPMNAKIICKDFPDFYITLNLQNLLLIDMIESESDTLEDPNASFDDTIISTSMRSIDARFIEEDLVRIDSIDELGFWIEIVVSYMIYECGKVI